MLIVLMSIYLMNLSMRGVDSQIGGCLWSDGNCIIGLQMPPAKGQLGQGVVLNIYVLYVYM